MKKRHQQNRIRILNPRDPGQLFTSENSAADMVRRGAAVYVTGVPDDLGSSPRGLIKGPGIRLINNDQRRRSEQAEEARRRDASIVEDRGGVICWEGCQPGSRRLPTEGTQLFVSPAKVTGYFNPDRFNPDNMRGSIVHSKLYPPVSAQEKK